MRVVIGSDHGGFHLKEFLIRKLEAKRCEVVDVGTFSADPCDYPGIGAKVGEAVSKRQAARGILLCKSGAGMAMVANKFPGVRAAVCSTAAGAKHAREHNDANVLVLGASELNEPRGWAILSAWLATPFSGGRHARRVNQIQQIEKRVMRRC